MTGSARHDVREDTPEETHAHGDAQHRDVDHALFAGPGEMRARCRIFDWGATPLGPVERWPEALCTTVRLCLDSRFPMCVFNGPELILVYNDRYAEVLGVAKHPWALGRPAREVWAEIWCQVEPELRKALGGAATWHEDQRFVIGRNGHEEEAFFTYSFSPVRADDGAVLGVLSVLTETTERVRLLAALEVERSRLGAVFRQAPVAITVLRGRVAADLVYELVNPRYLELIPPGRAPLGRRLGDVLPEMDDELMRALQSVLDTGEPFVASDFPASLDRDGDGTPETYYFNFVYHPLIEADGAVAGVVGIGTEVTESVRARQAAERMQRIADGARTEAEAARAAAERLQALTAALSDATSPPVVGDIVMRHGVAALGAYAGVLALRTAEAAELELLSSIGYPADACMSVGRRWPLTTAIPITEAARTGEPVFVESPEAWGQRYIGGYAPKASASMAWAALPLAVEGEPQGALLWTYDHRRIFGADERALMMAITRQCAQALERARLHEAERAARAETERARERAEEASRAKSEFLAVMSHELRTPLNAIGGYAELMEMGLRGPVTAQQREDLARIQKSQTHLLGLINEVLNYTRVETGAVRYELADVPLAEVLVTVESMVAPQIRAKELAFTDNGCGPGLTVRADRDKLQQILVNLLSNAVKFTDSGGRIEVSCEDTRNQVAIRVRDTGIGIPSDKLENIFEPFVQVDARLTRTQEGVGLGLAISRDLARGMGGDLTAESTPGEGSVFTLLLPRVA